MSLAKKVIGIVGDEPAVVIEGDAVRVIIEKLSGGSSRKLRLMQRLARVYAAVLRAAGFDVEHVIDEHGREAWRAFYDEPRWVPDFSAFERRHTGAGPVGPPYVGTRVEARCLALRAELLVRA